MNSEERPLGGTNQGRGDGITVWVGGHGLVGSLPRAGRLLVVEAEPERARELRHELGERPEAQVCEEVLAAETGAVVRWYRFNDERLSGPSGLNPWQQRFPNLRQTDEAQRYGRSLGEVLDNFATHEGGVASAPLHLTLRQGDPLAALMGLGPWMSQLETVKLLLPWPEGTMQMVETWLKERHFYQNPQSAATWERDPISERDWLLKKKENEIHALLSANQKLREELEAMQLERERFAAKGAEDLTQWKEELQREIQKQSDENSLLIGKLEVEEAASLDTREALIKLFPMQEYKEGNPDLADFDEDRLVLHYVQHGQHEGRLKPYQDLDAELKISLKRTEDADSKVAQLEAQFELAHQQLETLKDVFARLADRPKSAKKEKKE
jgi:hypothetical protein